MSPPQRTTTHYARIVERLFFSHYTEGATEVLFARDELVRAAEDLDIEVPKNLGDVIYSARHRMPLPQSIIETARDGEEWIVEGAGKGSYRFKLVGLANKPRFPRQLRR
jgi:hypothetical protein